MKTQVIKPGVVSTGRRIKGGFNLNRFVKDLLVSLGFAATDDCCNYYPTFPILDVANPSAPTPEEVAANHVPDGGLFLTTNGGTYYLWIVADGQAGQFATND